MLGWSCSRYTIALRDHVPPHFLFIALNVNFTKKTSSYNFHFHWKCYNPKYWCFSKPRIVYIYNLKGNKKKKSKSNKLKKKTNKRKRKEKGKKEFSFQRFCPIHAERYIWSLTWVMVVKIVIEMCEKQVILLVRERSRRNRTFWYCCDHNLPKT